MNVSRTRTRCHMCVVQCSVHNCKKKKKENGVLTTHMHFIQDLHKVGILALWRFGGVILLACHLSKEMWMDTVHVCLCKCCRTDAAEWALLFILNTKEGSSFDMHVEQWTCLSDLFHNTLRVHHMHGDQAITNTKKKIIKGSCQQQRSWQMCVDSGAEWSNVIYIVQALIATPSQSLGAPQATLRGAVSKYIKHCSWFLLLSDCSTTSGNPSMKLELHLLWKE